MGTKPHGGGAYRQRNAGFVANEEPHAATDVCIVCDVKQYFRSTIFCSFCAAHEMCFYAFISNG